MSILLDAGPSLNFLAVGQQNVLVQLAASEGLRLAAPERVDIEVRSKAKSVRFRRTAVAGTWGKLTGARRIEVLSDDLERQELADVVARVSGMPAAERTRNTASLGEIMVIAHASVFAQQGTDVFILMDDGDGRARAARERDWLLRHQARGALVVWSTRQVLMAASDHPDWFKNGQTWTAVYKAMCEFDDGLVRI